MVVGECGIIFEEAVGQAALNRRLNDLLVLHPGRPKAGVLDQNFSLNVGQGPHGGNP